MIRAVLFDYDNTLVSEDDYILAVFSRLRKKINIEIDAIQKKLSYQFRLKSKDIFGDMLKEVQLYTPERQEELFQLYQSIDLQQSMYEDAEKFTDFLLEQGIKLGIITNGVLKAQRNKISNFNQRNLFNPVIFAREKGKSFEKPNAYSFNKALKAMQVNPNEALFVGDHPKTDVKGAINVGMNCARLVRGYTSLIPNTLCKNYDSFEQIENEYWNK